jgi:hypothetical protein
MLAWNRFTCSTALARAADYSKAGDRFLDFCLLTSTHPAIQSLRASIQLSVEELYEELSSTNPKYRSIQELIESPAHGAAPNHSGSRPGGAENKSEWQKHAKGRCFMRDCIVMSLLPNAETPLQYLSKALRGGSSSSSSSGSTVVGGLAHHEYALATPRRSIPSNIGGVFGNMVPDGLFFLQLSVLLSVGTMTRSTQTYVCDDSDHCR